MDTDDIIHEVSVLSEPVFDGDFAQFKKSARFLLEAGGCKYRYWLGENEKPIELLASAISSALDKAKMSASDIDLVIYTGMGKGFLEPGDAYFVANYMGMENAICFDILDACISWTRACELVQNYFLLGKYKTALVVNAERFFGDNGLGYPSSYELKSIKELPYCFSAWVGSDGASATILQKDEGNDWDFHFSSQTKYTDLCTIPLNGWEGRCKVTDRLGKNGIGAFTAWGSAMFTYGGPGMSDILKTLEDQYGSLKTVFCHTGGPPKEFQKLAEAANAGHLVKYIYPEYGNVGSGSMPASIVHFEEQGEIARGDKIAGWVASSGFAFAAFTFVY
ncbi:hypothetical protein [Janthinobacterium fluminis]|uniref:3-oxoacyl-[acyl-carrier-protein] synthase III n=1 Tax=Janthinobacterium fluminis TaxID=2987524 RepID=A0ABT5K1S0_9BURK|nr:hypothetical protein [Janthinobacterium fluminis]MDC8758932.1 hypothetical protein [Janthinobacterium fluminis]